jgi:hypothetical protein
MTKDELVKKLEFMGVHQGSYSLGVIKNSDCTCVVDEGGIWKVYYVERDKPTELATFQSEFKAYDFVYDTFFRWTGKE